MEAATVDNACLVASSLSGRRWSLRAHDARAAQALSRELELPELLARVLLSRGVTLETAERFLSPSLKASLPDPSHLKDMDEAAERIAGALMQGETIAIFGDYDVDGATSSALLRKYFHMLGRDALLYIPDRMREGYGPNEAALMQLKERGASVVITVDCGTQAHQALAAAHAAGLDVIVVDHHIGASQRPQAFAIINPNRLDETSPHRHLAAVGVAFLLAVAVTRQLRRHSWFATRPEPELLTLLDLAALGTVCDVVALTGVNRALVAQGLKVMAGRANCGLRALMDVARVDEPPGTYHAGFILGPRINAGGRVGKADYGALLLSGADEAEMLTLARALDGYNEERKAIEAMVLEEALAMAEAQAVGAPVLLVAKAGWHPGVIGIVAGRLKERFHRPAAVVALDGATGKASARSVAGFDFGAAVLAAVEAGLLVSGGGHAMAAGFTAEAACLPALHALLCERFARHGVAASAPMHVDGVIALSGVTVELAQLLGKAAPFGQGNPEPRLMIHRASVAAADCVGGNHIRLILIDENRVRLPVMAYRAAGTAFGEALQRLCGRQVHAAGHVRARIWQGTEQAAFTLDDIALA